MSTVPSAMAGVDRRKWSHSVPSARDRSQTPVTMMGTESSSVTRVSARITLLLIRIAMDCALVGGAGAVLPCPCGEGDLVAWVCGAAGGYL